jgi:hypothetical protein
MGFAALLHEVSSLTVDCVISWRPDRLKKESSSSTRGEGIISRLSREWAAVESQLLFAPPYFAVESFPVLCLISTGSGRFTELSANRE